MDALKKERVKIKTAFTKRANYVLRMATTMVQDELKDEWKLLSIDARKLLSANDDCEAGLLAEVGEDAEALDAQLRADIERVTRECELKVEEVSQVVKSNLWSRYAETELISAVGRAERSYESAEEVGLKRVTYDNGKEQNALLEGLISKAENLLAVWKEWIPEDAKRDMSKRLQRLEDKRNELWLRWVADFGKVQRMEADMIAEAQQKAADEIAEAEERAAEARKKAAEAQQRMAEAAEKEHAELATAQRKAWEEAHSTNMANPEARGVQAGAIPRVRLQPTRLPRFSGCMRDFHR